VKDLKGNGHGMIEVLTQNLPGGTEESRVLPQYVSLTGI
jgi:hypothetical protein